MKVKKFRIKPRLPVVGKILKGLMSTKKLPFEIEETLPKEVESFVAHLSPAAFYQTWAQGSVPAPFHEGLSGALDHAVAVTAVVATIGQPPEAYMGDVLLNGETARSQIIQAISEESADLAFNFIHRLLIDDAKGDDCEISEPVFITDHALLAETLAVMEADQEGVSLDTAEHLSPRFTRVALFSWTPIKKKKSAASSKKKA